MRNLPRPRPAALAVPAVTMLASTLLLAGCGSDESTTASDDTGASSGSPAPASTPTDSPTATGSGAGGSSAQAIAVYYVGDGPAGPRLFREFQAGDGGDPLLQAAQALTTGSPSDPDYRSALPSTLDITGVTAADGAITVQVSADSPTSADKSMDPDLAALAVQQLVYSLDAASQTRDPVRVVQGDGSAAQPVDLFGQDTADGVKAGDPLDVLGLVNVTEPEQGAAVSGTLHASGVASSFEGTVPWAIHSGDADGPIVKQGAASADGYIDKLYPWSADVDLFGLRAGDYTFVAMTDDPSGGKEGPGATEDTKAFTIG